LDEAKIRHMERVKANVILQACLIDSRYYCSYIRLETQLFFIEYDKKKGKFTID